MECIAKGRKSFARLSYGHSQKSPRWTTDTSQRRPLSFQRPALPDSCGASALSPGSVPEELTRGKKRSRLSAIICKGDNYVEKSSKRWAFPNPAELIPSLD